MSHEREKKKPTDQKNATGWISMIQSFLYVSSSSGWITEQNKKFKLLLTQLLIQVCKSRED